MREFEKVKSAGNYSKCEATLARALQFGQSEYAVGSLAWAQMKQDKTEVACQTASEMSRLYGQTAYTMATIIDANLKDGGFETALTTAEAASRSDQMVGNSWQNQYLRDVVRTAFTLKAPAVYELGWTIPGDTFTPKRPARLFGFPILKHASQIFRYTLSGEKSSKVVSTSEDETVIEIIGEPGKDVSVKGTATIFTRALGARTIRRLSAIPLTPSSPKETGVFYYGAEAHDPTDPSIAELAKKLRRSSAMQTVQALLDWRDKEMPYRELKPGPGTHLARIISQKCGVCHDASYLLAALARANGIPAYVVGCVSLPWSETFKDQGGAHGHICVKLPEVGWTDVEPLNRESLRFFKGSNILRFSRQEAMDPRDAISMQQYLVSGTRR